jgi:hypothetical protein
MTGNMFVLLCHLQLDNDNFCTPKIHADVREIRIKSLYLRFLDCFLFLECYWRGDDAMLYNQIFDFLIHLMLAKEADGTVP